MQKRRTSRARTLSGQSHQQSGQGAELSRESCPLGPGQDDLSGKSMSGQPRDRILSEESRNMKNKLEGGWIDSIISSDDTKSQSWENVSETNSNSDVLEIAIHSLLVDWKQRGLDRQMHQDPDRDRYTSDEEGTVVDNAEDEFELLAVSKRWARLLPRATVTRTSLEPLDQEAPPLKKIWCVKMMDDAHYSEIISGQLNIRKTYLKTRYRLSDLLRAQRNDKVTKNLKRWIERAAINLWSTFKWRERICCF